MDDYSPVPTGPLARKGDPATARLAAAELKGSTELGKMQAEALDWVRKNPGLTANELSRLAGTTDSRRIPRRLNELQKAGLVYTSGEKADPLTRKLGMRWWPVDSGTKRQRGLFDDSE